MKYRGKTPMRSSNPFSVAYHPRKKEAFVPCPVEFKKDHETPLVTIHEPSEKAQDDYRYSHGSDTVFISEEEIDALRGGKMLAWGTRGGEYITFVVKKKFDCHPCKHIKHLSGKDQCKCEHPAIKTKEINLNVRAHYKGMTVGEFNYPHIYNPKWLLNCDGFEEKK